MPPAAPNTILTRMLDRLFASLVSGPGLNCRPHSSRQRIDLAGLSRLMDAPPEAVLRQLLSGAGRAARLSGKASRPKKLNGLWKPAAEEPEDKTPDLSDDERRMARQWSEQSTLVGKLRTIAEDARTYEQDTGVHVLNIGFPLLSMPPGFAKARRGGAGGFQSRRIVAPIAFLPVTLDVSTGAKVTVEIACKGQGVDLVRPNIALLSWLEGQTGIRTPELFEDTDAEDPWREITGLVAHVAKSLGLPVPEVFSNKDGLGDAFRLEPAPRSDDDTEQGRLLPSAVLGLFPMANEGLLRDMQALVGGEELRGPIASFLDVNLSLGTPPEEHPDDAAGGTGKSRRAFAEERLVTQADPCQSRAALMARKAAGLVIHGPPGTGKSQTITNIIGDHLARGQRVLMVCDKRTALDVVAHRLDFLGFGPLVALVHDPQRDQRDLYKQIRESLENLADLRTHKNAAHHVEKIDAELQALHNDLTAYWQSLMAAGGADGTAASFHDLMGEWLAIADEGITTSPAALADVPLDTGRSHERLIRELLDRGITAGYPGNPWAGNAALPLREFLSQPAERFRTALKACSEAAQKAQIAVDEAVPALGAGDLLVQGELRLNVAERLEKLIALDAPEALKRWAGADARALKKAAAALDAQATALHTFRDGPPLDAELWAAVKSAPPTIGELTARLGKLNEYLTVARKWFALFALGKKRLAREVLTPLGLSVNADNAERAKTFLTALRARLILRDLLAELASEPAATTLPDDDTLTQTLDAHAGTLALLQLLAPDERRPLARAVEAVLRDPGRAPALAEALRKSAARAAALRTLEETLQNANLWTPDYLARFSFEVRKNPAYATVELDRLSAALPTLEHLLRIRDGLAELPPGLAAAVTEALGQSAPAHAGMAAVTKALLAAEISRRLRNDPVLQAMDGQRLQSAFERYRALDAQKRTAVRDAALHLWATRQKDRLLASTLTRLSPLGADLRRRLTLRGERAMRLRQVVDVGRGIEGGDPLFDMCPVWMASPETVAQVFPREPLFDVVIFDEASQCRLEEALPVLTRGKRVVIAGDPKQLPPTRFFESAVTASEDDEVTGEQDLFEKQQGEVEDLLTAALNLSIENAYLDVHYRSRNSDLIAFSNEQFYNHRLQAIPGHPSNATRFCPLTLYRADGIYEDRANEKEADTVCRIVRDLLKRAEPPSIGIACFNLVQRDLILEKLDELALADEDFARRLAAARTRMGKGSFEGLFVKNLENVQGDERDHIIISTTYGPQKDGRFYQRFGPLARAGGGRRLNVLVTRAREEVHLVTSIPAELYRTLPPVPAGQTPGGAWLLYAYLQFAERLADLYKDAGATHNAPATNGHPHPLHPSLPPEVRIHAPRNASLPSRFSETLAHRLAATHRLGSLVHWGNDGFCIDLAVAHPARPGDVTVGVLCDSNRYLHAPDPVEWDLFRTAVHESQGWTLHRVWTPQFFRDTDAQLAAIARAIEHHVATEKPQDALGVTPAK
jgi:hypothetical protein